MTLDPIGDDDWTDADPEHLDDIRDAAEDAHSEPALFTRITSEDLP